MEAQETRVLAKLKSAKARKGTRHWDYGDAFDPAIEKKALDPAKVFDLDKEAVAFQGAVMPAVTNVYERFGEATAATLGTVFNLRDEAVAANLLARSNRLAQTTETTWHAVQEAIIDGEAKGEGIDKIAKRIGRVMEQAKGYRSRVIARTETIGATNAGSYQAALSSGVVGKKVWLAASDHRTRSSHISADGQEVDLKKKFRVGASTMEYPGDPAGGASEVVNCRCSMLYKRDDAETQDDILIPEEVPSIPEDGAVTRTGVPLNQKPPTFTSRADAEDWLQAKWGKTTKRVSVRDPDTGLPTGRFVRTEVDRVIAFDGIDGLEAMNRITALVDEQFTLHPEVADRILKVGTYRGVGVTRMGPGVKGQALRHDYLVIDEFMHSNVATAAETVEKAWAQGWWSSKDPFAVFIHEFGHHVHYTLEEAMGFRYGDEAAIRSFLKPILKEVSGLKGNVSPVSGAGKAWLYQNLSKYATKNVYEVMAEAWAEYQRPWSKSRPFARAVGEAIEAKLAHAQEIGLFDL